MMKFGEYIRQQEAWVGHKTTSYGDMSYRVGRYELNALNGMRMRLDYALDPLKIPDKYGRFYSFFVSRFNPAGVVDYARIMIRKGKPTICMGNFDFNTSEPKRYLKELAKGEIDQEVAVVLQEVLRLSNMGQLKKVRSAP